MVVGLNYSAFKTLFQNAEGMAEGSEYVENTYSLKDLTRFIAEKPVYVSVMSYNVNQPDSGIFYQVDIPHTLGFMGSIFLVAEYERQVADGILDPGEVVNKDEIQQYALPQIYQNAHNGAMEVLTADDGTFTLDEAVSAMLEYQSLPVFDYLWFRLGEDNIRTMMADFELEHTEMPVPFSGLYLVISPILPNGGDQSGDAAQHFESLGQFSRDQLQQMVIDRASDQNLLNRSKEIIEKDRLGLTFMEERTALNFFPQTTARELTSVMEIIYKDELISEEVSKAIKEKMRWSFDSEPIQRSFSDYGAIYDNRMGLLSGFDFGTSIYDGHTSIQAVFFDKLPIAFWHHMSANHMQEDYQQRLIWDPALYETTLNMINNESTKTGN
mgnify:CR=1 FL=1